VIDAALIPGRSGGVEQATRRMIQALGRLSSGASPDEYVIVTHPDAPNWLDDVAGPNQRIQAAPRTEMPSDAGVSRVPRRRPPLWRFLPESLLSRGRAARLALTPARRFGIGSMARPNRFIESFRPDVVYYPLSCEVSSSVRGVVTMHDLQHRYYPENFNKVARWRRDTVWPHSCLEAAAVVAVSHCTKKDLVRFYRIPNEKIHVVHHGATQLTLGKDSVERLLEPFGVPPAFALYPAQTWPHKNHIRLLRALARLRDIDGLEIPVVCAGRLNEHWPEIARELHKHRLEEQVRFIGYVTEPVLAALYSRARFLVYPSLFEGAGLPVIEAFASELPVACSRIPPLIECGGDAILDFDPMSPQRIAEAMKRLWSDDNVRVSIARKGVRRAAQFTWESSASRLRALLRACAGATLSSEDRLALRPLDDAAACHLARQNDCAAT